MSKLLLDQIRRKIDKATVISFDIFDTLLVRPYVAPTDVFVHMEKAYDRPGFANERRDAERRARIRHKELEDITFDMIYEEIDPEYRDLKQKELDWEAMVLRPNPELKQVYDYALSIGKRIIIASDMYLPTEFIASTLRKNGFDGWEKLYVSGDVGKRKIGSLYYSIIDDASVSAASILHIGDNPLSDYDYANIAGVSSILIKGIVNEFLSVNLKAEQFWKKKQEAFGASLLLGLYAYRWKEQCLGLQASDNYWYELGYSYAAPLVYGFCQFIEKIAQEDKIDHLLFIARSGCIIKQAFDVLYDGKKTSYVYASRALKAICHLQYDHPEELVKIIDYFCDQSEELRKRYATLKDKKAESLKYFFEANRKVFENLAAKKLTLYHRYVESICNKSERMLLVDDMAANFSAQYLLEDAIGQKMKGAYIAVYHQDKYNHFERVDYAHTYFKGDLKGKEVDVWSYKWRFVEMLLGAPEPPVVDIDEHGVIHMSNQFAWEQTRIHISQHLNKAVIDFVHDIHSLFHGRSLYLEYDTIIAWINSYLLAPDRKDFAAMRKVMWDWKTFNSDEVPLLIKPRKFLDYIICKNNLSMGMNGSFFWKSRNRIALYVKEIIDSKNKTIRFLGVPVYKKTFVRNQYKRKILFGLLRTVKTATTREVFILGIRISRKQKGEVNNNQNILRREIAKYNAVRNLHHKVFTPYKNIHNGASIAIVATGPTLQFYRQIPDTIHIGVNRTFMVDSLKLDYLFMQDYEGVKDYIGKCASVKCTKFIGLFLNTELPYYKKIRIPESEVNRLDCFCFYNGDPYTEFEYDLTAFPLRDKGTIVHPAMQFAFWCGVKKIYLIGCDTATTGYYDKSIVQKKFNPKVLIEGYLKLKQFAKTYYPETEIISINPVGLKGIYRDVYTESYLRAHPEIDPSTVEILKEDENDEN